MEGFNYNANFQAFNSRIACTIEDGIIYAIDYQGKKQVGYTDEQYNQLAETTTEYYNKLVEMGVIVPEKTSEDILRETQEALRESQAINIEMLQLLKEMRGGTQNESSPAPAAGKVVPAKTKRNSASSDTSISSDSRSE